VSQLIQFARARAVERAAVVNQEREHVLANPGEDPVHDLRVALRRMEQVFEVFDIEPLAFDSQTAHKQLNEWLRAAGRVRDCDVVMPLLEPPWTNDLLSYRRDRAKELVEALRAGPMASPNQHRYRGPALAEEVAQFARITLPREAKEYFKAGARAAHKNHSLGRLHEFRLHGKSLRYSIELFEPLYGPRLGQLTKLLKRTQQSLGEMADARAGLKLVKQMNAPDSALEPLRRLANEKREAFAQRWREEVPDEEIAAAQWIDYLRRFARVPRAGRPTIKQ
jgi:CHAD domain-containing protein